MDLKRILGKLGRMDKALDSFIDRAFLLFAFVFGAWLTWSVLGAAEVSYVVQVGGSLIGALVSALAMWIVWFFAKLLI